MVLCCILNKLALLYVHVSDYNLASVMSSKTLVKKVGKKRKAMPACVFRFFAGTVAEKNCI